MVRPQYWLMVAVVLVGILIGSFAPMGILLGPMMCGIYLCLLGLMRGERIEFGLLFKGSTTSYRAWWPPSSNSCPSSSS